MIADKLERPKQLIHRSYMFLSEINNKQYHFDRINVEVEALKNVTKAQLYDFYKVYFQYSKIQIVTYLFQAFFECIYIFRLGYFSYFITK